MTDTGADPRRSGERNPAVDRLIEEVEAYLGARAQRLLVGVGRRLGETTVKLNDIAQGRSAGLGKLALAGGRELVEGKGPLRSAVELGAGRLKDRAKQAVRGLGEKVGAAGRGGKKGRGGTKPTVIIEHVDIGVPVREAYDQWTQFREFNTFAQGVKSVSQEEATSRWTAKIFWSTRNWKGVTQEEIPDERIAWGAEADKGTHRGVVTFHPLGDRLTRVLLLIEYHPQGLFEKTGFVWRAQGRRVRLDLKHFARFVTMRGEATGAWRGEIRDGEVVSSHEEAEEAEQAEQAERQEQRTSPQGREPAARGREEPEDQYEAEAEPGNEYEVEDEYGAEAEAEEEGEPKEERAPEEEGEPADQGEPEEEYDDEYGEGYEEGYGEEGEEEGGEGEARGPGDGYGEDAAEDDGAPRADEAGAQRERGRDRGDGHGQRRNR